MKYSDLSSKKRSSYFWISCAAASLFAVALSGCGGSDNNNNNPPPVATVTTTTLPATAVVPVPVPPGTPVDATTLTPTQFAALAPTVPVDATGNQSISVTIASAPKVTFALTDGAGGPPIKGFGSKVQSATATVASTPNLSFALAKLIPESTSTLQGRTLTIPSRWVSYIVTTVPTKNATTGAITASVPTRPSTDNTGTLVDNGNGTYTYTFFRDITQAKAAVAAGAETAVNKNADLDDLTYDANLVHRLTIQISGNAPGTGNNTPTGATDPAKPAVVMTKPTNVIFDFIPATGKAAVSGRDIATTNKCNDCHQSLGGFPGASASNVDAEFHGGSRNKVEYCSVCHTDQRKYGRAEAVVDAAGNYDGLSTYRINGLGVGMLSTHIHKIHMSANLVKTGYNYGDILYEEACKFPQDVRNCTRCHDNSATTTPDATRRGAQGDNWMKVPNRRACGACHDGINFITGAGVTLANKIKDVTAGVAIGTTATGHEGGPQSDDAACAFCHAPADIDLFHLPVTAQNPKSALAVTGGDTNTNAAAIASNKDRLPAGAIKVSYEISSVALNASRNPVMVFRMLQNGTAVPLNTFVAPASSSKEIWPNFMGAPSVYFVFAVPQDGITAPADFNGSASVYLRSLWNGVAPGTLSGPDATGFYTATLTGSTIPANAVMLTGGLGYSYNVTSSLPLTQTNVAGYPTAPAVATGLNAVMPNKTGGLIVVVPNVQKVATGFTGRRAIVSDALCNNCHLELGIFTEDVFHAGQRNDGTTCSWCHTPNRTSSGWSADSTSFVHGIHAAAKRTLPYTWHAVLNADGSIKDSFASIGYPGVLKNCETCHLPGTYDFSAAGSTIPSPNNRQYRAVATGTFSATTRNDALPPASLVPRGVDFGTGFAFDANGAPTTGAAAGNPLNLVTSPIATACFACHDTATAMQHMENEGASIYRARGTTAAAGGTPLNSALAKQELCMLCHSSTSAFGLGIKAVHASN